MRKLSLIYLLFFFIFAVLNVTVSAENIHFSDYLYKFKTEKVLEKDKTFENGYYRDNENENFWTSKVDVFYYPDVQNPLKFAQEADKRIESNERDVLLKFVQNKKQSIAVISYLENGIGRDGNFFIYNIYKYEKHPKRGMMVMRYAQKYVFNTNEDISKIGQEIRKINNDYIERIIVTTIPEINKK